MSKAVFNPVIVRPTFGLMKLVTPRLFETPAASTIPLFGLDPSLVREIYGDQAFQLTLTDIEPKEKILDILQRPERYADIVRSIREHLSENHSHKTRLQELIHIVES
jgi:hypothetical protein